MSWVPENGVGVEVLCGIEPEVKLLLPVAFALCKHISVQCVRISAEISKELEVNLIMGRSL